nr:unnamed protein product [Callosobruchus chinensis]
MLPNGHIVKDTLLGDKGIMKGINKNALFIDSSTIEPQQSQELGKIAKENGFRYGPQTPHQYCERVNRQIMVFRYLQPGTWSNANVPPSNQYKGGFGVSLIAKDLALAENAALSAGAPLPLGAISHQLYRTLIANGYGR